MPDDRFLHRRAGHSEKVTMLTDLEYRVWTQYLLSADDFGVMRASAVTLQADNDHLANRPGKMIQRCIEALAKAGGLLRTFEHQGRRYLYQHDWQDWQKVAYPRSTNQPAPNEDALAECSKATQLLFSMHPGGAGKRRKERSENEPRTFSEHSQNVPETVSESSPLMRAGTPAKRLTANGLRLTANGSEVDGQAEFMKFQAAYPDSRRKGGRLVMESYVIQMAKAGGPDVLMAALANHKASQQWQAAKHIPGMDTWLDEERWRQVLPSPAESAPVANVAGRPAWMQ